MQVRSISLPSMAKKSSIRRRVGALAGGPNSRCDPGVEMRGSHLKEIREEAWRIICELFA